MGACHQNDSRYIFRIQHPGACDTLLRPAFAQRELGDIVFIDVDTVGEEVVQDDVFGTIEAVKTVSDLFMPVTATVLELNDKLDAAPELVNQDPYWEGWLERVKLNNSADVEGLLSAADYEAQVTM